MQENPKKPLQVLIFGAGAIGTYIGVPLANQGHRCVFLERPAAASTLRQNGLRLDRFGRVERVSDPQITTSPAEALQQYQYDLAVFAIKSFDTRATLAALDPDLAKQFPPVLCLQNGVDNEPILAEYLGADKVIPGTVTSALGRRQVGDVVLERQRGIGIAANHPLAVRLAGALNDALLNAQIYPRVQDMKWSKLLTNLLGNATSAILNMTPSQVFAHPDLFRLEIAQLREALQVMSAQGIRVTDLPGTPIRALAFAVQRLPAWISQPLIQRAVGRGRGGKMPSLHIDLHGGSSRSEVGDLNGAVARYGERYGLPTPVNRLLAETLTALVKQEVPLESYAHRPDELLRKLRIT